MGERSLRSAIASAFMTGKPKRARTATTRSGVSLPRSFKADVTRAWGKEDEANEVGPRIKRYIKRLRGLEAADFDRQRHYEAFYRFIQPAAKRNVPSRKWRRNDRIRGGLRRTRCFRREAPADGIELLMQCAHVGIKPSRRTAPAGLANPGDGAANQNAKNDKHDDENEKRQRHRIGRACRRKGVE